ncbi:MAG TPA: DUF4956 domain-containing protein [Pyrinomonadaceae bacterium]|nr:DUF4956 domain-containing protein [Pyrinomonadaceae bacterium]
MNKQTTRLVAVFVSVLVVSALLSYFIFNRPANRARQQTDAAATATQTPAAQQQQQQTQPGSAQRSDAPAAQGDGSSGGGHNGSFFSRMFGTDSEASSGDGGAAPTTGQILMRFALAALLAALLAFRPRKRHLAVLARNPYVAQTQILLAVVASALMMVVGDSAARAFGIFAAASLVRFRTNIRDPKEITVLLTCLGIGLATGVARPELAVILAFFVLVTLWALEYFESSLLFRAMELRVTTRNVDGTNALIKSVFSKHKFSAELRQINRENAPETPGRIVYHVNVGANISTDALSEEIVTSDPNDAVDSIEWQPSKTGSYIYG